MGGGGKSPKVKSPKTPPPPKREQQVSGVTRDSQIEAANKSGLAATIATSPLGVSGTPSVVRPGVGVKTLLGQ